MFGKKIKKEKVNNDEELVNKVNQDLLVRNMPSAARLSGSDQKPIRPLKTGDGVLSTMAPQKNNHQTIGILIISGGIVLIGALIYLSYVFIIKPQASTGVGTVPLINKVQENSNVLNVQSPATNEEVLTASTSIVATITPTTLDLASSTASSTLEEGTSTLSNLNLAPIVDTDSDGLNDNEEAVLGSNPALADSNNNGYVDLAELNNNYDPTGSGKISTNKNLALYNDKSIAYTLLYPKDWSNSSLSSNSILVFTAPDDSIIQISVQENTDKQSIMAWFGNSFPDQTITYDKIKSTPTWDGVFSSDNLNFYLTDKKKKNIYIVSYIPAISDHIVYPNIFNLMINSLTIR